MTYIQFVTDSIFTNSLLISIQIQCLLQDIGSNVATPRDQANEARKGLYPEVIQYNSFKVCDSVLTSNCSTHYIR